MSNSLKRDSLHGLSPTRYRLPPTNNLTDDPLLVEQTAAELARQGGPVSRVLYLEVRRWKPDAPSSPRFVIVALNASVVDAASGQDLARAPARGAGAEPVCATIPDATRD